MVTSDNTTCKDCKHFCERELKEWHTFLDLGLCDHSFYGTAEISKNCPINRCCDNEYTPKEDTL